MGVRKMFLNINGVDKMILCDNEKDTLADVLRSIGLTGTKVGCGTGQCGACSVLLDGKVVRSCILKMKTLKEYSKIVTIEGIGTPTNLHPLQLAWIVYGGVQCGFCSPGFIVSAKGLLDTNPNPTREDVRNWFQKHRNACRCTGYKPLVDAVMAAAKVLRGEMTMEELSFKIPEDQRIYGTRYPRPAALSKVTGTCDYGDDLNMKLTERMDALQLAIVQTEVSHANILSIDTSEAEKMPGVFKVITAKDVKGTNRFAWGPSSPRCKGIGWETPIIADDKIHRRGDVIALVAADTRENAREAAKKVKYELERLPEYMNLLDAVQEDALEVNKGIPNVYLELPVMKGEDTRNVMNSAAYVVEDSFHTTSQPHLVIEPETAMAYFDDEGNLTIHCKSLAIFYIPITIAAGIGFPQEKIRVIENPTGASFGYTTSPLTGGLIAAAVLATGRPCCLTLDYQEHQLWTGKRAASYTNIKMAADEKGKLSATEFMIAYDKGAYSNSNDLGSKGIRFMGAPYTIPNVRGISKLVATNNSYSTAFRAFGSPQTAFATEQIIDELAEKVGMDPLEFRAVNVYHPGDTSINGHTFSVYPVPELIDRLRPFYQEAVERAKKESTPEKRRGVGIACGTFNVTGGTNDHCEMKLALNPDGTVTHYNQWEDQGQGGDIGTLVHTHEALRPLGLRPDQIKLVMNDTKLCPVSGGAWASRSHYMVGNATINAANKLMNAMRKPDGTYRTYDEMVAEGIPTEYLGVYDTTCPEGTEPDINNGQGNPTPDYTYGVFLVEVEVDTATGKTKVLKMHLEADVGVIGSMQAVEGQALGGLVQGIGLALSEDYNDQTQFKSLISCGFPYIEDVTDNLEVNHLETPRPKGPHGSAGCAELYLTAPHAAIVNAICNACGVRINELPATKEKVLTGLKAIENGEKRVHKPYNLGSDLHEQLDYIVEHPMRVTGKETEGLVKS